MGKVQKMVLLSINTGAKLTFSIMPQSLNDLKMAVRAGKVSSQKNTLF